MLKDKTISVVLPIYNEEQNIVELYEQLKSVLLGLGDYNYELVFVNDGSQDDSIKLLDELVVKDSKIKIIDFSRNFGKQIAIAAGLDNAVGDAVIVMDSDLQHPPKYISELVQKWTEGYLIVLTRRKQDKHVGWFKRFMSWMYLSMMNKISQINFSEDTSDFCLLDRVVVDEINKFRENRRLFRGIVNWVGFERTFVEIEVDQRHGGKTTFSFFSLVRLAMHGIISFSLFPLKLAGYLGVLITTLSSLIFLWMVISDYFDLQVFSPLGYAVILITFLNGITLMCLGFMALYVGQIQGEVLRRPLYVVKSKKSL